MLSHACEAWQLRAPRAPSPSSASASAASSASSAAALSAPVCTWWSCASSSAPLAMACSLAQHALGLPSKSSSALCRPEECQAEREVLPGGVRALSGGARVRCLGTCQPPKLVLSTPGWLQARRLASLASSALSGAASCSWSLKRCRGTWDLLPGELELAIAARPLGRGTLSTRCDFQVLEARAVSGTSAPARGSRVKVAAAGSERLPWPSASRALCTGEVCGEGRGSRPRNGSKSASTAPRPRRIGRSQAIAKRARPELVVQALWPCC